MQQSLFSDGGFGFEQNPTQFQAHAQTPANHPQQPPPPYSKNPYPQPYSNKPQYPGPYQGNPNPNQMPNPGMKSPIMNNRQFIQQFMRPQQQPNPNMAANMANMLGAGGFNKQPRFQNQVRSKSFCLLLFELNNLFHF